MSIETKWESENNKSQEYVRDWDIAVVGMAGRFPGSNSVSAFWDSLIKGTDSVSRWQTADEDADDNKSIGAFGKLQDMEWFAGEFFNIPDREALWMDPQQRFLLECVYEALEDAGYMGDRRKETVGLFCGSDDFTYVWENMYATTMHPLERARMRLFGESSLTARISYKLNLQGPSVVVRAACSTSLATVHLACQSLLNYECDVAVAGGVSITPFQDDGYLPVEGTLSPDGYTRPFDQNGQGCVPGNGIALVVLKRLKDAMLDGDQIYAVIKGSAINHDGNEKAGYAAPSVQGQMSVIRNALEMSDVKPGEIGYLECHGTATPLGDAVETKALKELYGKSRENGSKCYIGSVKGNVGHLNTAAGAAGLIKAILALKEGSIPPSLYCDQPHPELSDSPFIVNRHLEKWPDCGPIRRAAVSSFGLGGMNAHVVLEQAPSIPRKAMEDTAHLYVISADSPEELEKVERELKQFAERHENLRPDDVAYTLQIGRQHHRYRRFSAHQDVEEGLKHLSTQGSPAEADIVFLFPGAGANAIGLGAGLYERHAVFRDEMNCCFQVARRFHYADYDAMLFCKEQRTIVEPQLTEHFVYHFSLSYSLAKMWMASGIRPYALIGHSFGEYVAACISGLLPLEEAIRLTVARGKQFQLLEKGAMLSVALKEEVVQPFLHDGISIAAVNAVDRLLLSGEEQAILQLKQELSERNVPSVLLPSDRAGHSPLVDPILPALEKQLSSVAFGSMAIPIVSTLTGNWIDQDEMATVAYWSKQTRQTVHFAQALQNLKKRSSRPVILLEVGPGEQLGMLSRKQLDRKTTQIAATIPDKVEPTGEWNHFLHTVGRMWQSGSDIAWETLYGQGQPRRVSLPTYPFTRKKYWMMPTIQTDSATPRLLKKEIALINLDEQQGESDTGITATVGLEEELTYRNDMDRVLASLFYDVTGRIPSSLHEPLLSEGLDSLAYLELGGAIRKQYAVSISLRELFELETIAAISDFVSQRVESDKDEQKNTVSAAARGNKTWDDLIADLDK
ncbi:type I polyketide synthase [Brevibacillus porteri]|nr:type I polyketide synthase [Brevibacillus porteri]MED2744078.1 type I polyketide synthase [Brevibacillus porteri]MED2813292.1 type I polyketide synthase [Brevibacillus porteri]MED2896610.1 type I polyketide synthase [Brevibacillus porteri]MED4896083.1 type I polyketide synthase [Brevibacillus porteri]